MKDLLSPTHFIATLSALLLSPLTALYAADTPTPPATPNVILFLIDDVGWRDLGCQDSTYYQTPNIDRLADEGLRITDAMRPALSVRQHVRRC